MMQDWEKKIIEDLQRITLQYMVERKFKANKIVEQIRGDTAVTYSKGHIEVIFDHYQSDIIIIFKKNLLSMMFGIQQKKQSISMKKYMNVKNKITNFNEFVQRALEVMERDKLLK